MSKKKIKTVWYYNGVEERQFIEGTQPTGFIRGRKPRKWTQEQKDKMIENQKNHFREKYNCDWPQQNKEVRQKTINTCIERYGVVNNLNVDDVKIKAHSEEAKQKRINSYKQTMNNLYNVDNYYQTDEFKEHSKQIKFERYGDCFYNNREKARETMLDLYGVECAFSSNDSDINGKSSMIKKYGVSSYAQTDEWSSRRRVRYVYNDLSFDSLWELSFYVWAIDNNKDIKRCSLSFKYTHNNIDHIYHPDFIYDGRLIEIKGDHFFSIRGDKNSKMICPFDRSRDDEFEIKHQCMIDNNVEIWTYKDCKEYIDYFSLHYNIKDFII